MGVHPALLSESNRNQSGLSLIELAVVLAVLALLVAVVPGVIKQLFERNRPEVAAQGIALSLQRCALTAVETGISRVVEFTHTADSPGEPCLVLLPRDVPVNLPDPPVLMYLPDGSSTGMTIRVGSGEEIYTLDIDRLTGRVTWK